MLKNLKSIFLGKTLKTSDIANEKLNVLWGLPVMSSDAISSVAYASEEILWILVPVIGLAAYKNMFYAAMAIILLLGILVFSYRQTIDNYPNGGGAYIVATDNLGKLAGLVAAASLIIGYILTVAVSVCAGVAAITSAFPAILTYKIILAIFFIAIISLGNLRGLKESAIIFGSLTYLFIFAILILIVVGVFKALVLGEIPATTVSLVGTAENMTLLLFLKAFASGCTALTGVEVVSNGIPNFKAPSQKKAKQVLVLLALLVLIIFGGVSYLATIYKAVPSANVTIVAQIAIQVFGSNSIMFFIIQTTTAIILIMAANTVYAGLPLLLAVLAQDGYMPRQFANRGKRLSYSNGIMVLFFTASFLVFIFNGDTHMLLALYAIGVFLSFTLSQFGMVVKWIRQKGDGWRYKAIINGLGAAISGATCIIIGYTKFDKGAWTVLIAIPLVVILMLRIKRHYEKVKENLKVDINKKDVICCEHHTNHVIVPIETFNKSFIKCLNYAYATGDTVEVFHVSINNMETEKLIEKYNSFAVKAPLIIEKAPLRNINTVLVNYVDKRQDDFNEKELITVVVPQYTLDKWWHQALHAQTSVFIKAMLLKRRNVAIVTLPYIINE